VSLGWIPLTAGKRRVHLRHDRLAVADERHIGRLVVADLLGRDVELDDLDVRRIARRLPEMEDPVEAGAHQERNVSAGAHAMRNSTLPRTPKVTILPLNRQQSGNVSLERTKSRLALAQVR